MCKDMTGGCACSLHLLRHLGITHLLNATEDLLLPDPSAGFQCATPELSYAPILIERKSCS